MLLVFYRCAIFCNRTFQRRRGIFIARDSQLMVFHVLRNNPGFRYGGNVESYTKNPVPDERQAVMPARGAAGICKPYDETVMCHICLLIRMRGVCVWMYILAFGTVACPYSVVSCDVLAQAQQVVGTMRTQYSQCS